MGNYNRVIYVHKVCNIENLGGGGNLGSNSGYKVEVEIKLTGFFGEVAGLRTSYSPSLELGVVSGLVLESVSLWYRCRCLR